MNQLMVLLLGLIALALVTMFVTWVACETVETFNYRRARKAERQAGAS
jgi:hypothetical protein